MKKQITCIICPRGCRLCVDIEGETARVEGNACRRGEKYGIDECLHPTRTITCVIRVSNRTDTMVSVKTEAPIPKEHIFELMERIRHTEAAAPIAIGDVICDSLYGTRLVATKRIK